jgi:hypothetical protein
MSEPRARLIALLTRLAPDLAATLWAVHDVRALPRDTREAICDVLGHECADRGLDANEELNAYGHELDALVAALGLDDGD